jgi:hypothetical protein
MVILVMLMVRRAHALKDEFEDLEEDVGHDTGVRAACHHANGLKKGKGGEGDVGVRTVKFCVGSTASALGPRVRQSSPNTRLCRKQLPGTTKDQSAAMFEAVCLYARRKTDVNGSYEAGNAVDRAGVGRRMERSRRD